MIRQRPPEPHPVTKRPEPAGLSPVVIPPALPEPPLSWNWKKWLSGLGVVGFLILKFGAKFKFIILPVIKFFPVLFKTGGTMILSIGAYAMMWGWWFAVGFVLLIFIHECGHLLAARKCGLKVGAPVFIPFMGALIALKEAPRNAWIEAQVGIGGPLLGTLGAVGCELIYLATGNPMFRALAYTGFFLNLFNLAPFGFLDGGRIVTALSPWLWLVGLVIVGGLMIAHPSIILFLILIFSAPRLFSLFRHRSEEEQRYYEVTPRQRWTMAVMYFGLIALLVAGMRFTHIPTNANRVDRISVGEDDLKVRELEKQIAEIRAATPPTGFAVEGEVRARAIEKLQRQIEESRSKSGKK